MADGNGLISANLAENIPQVNNSGFFNVGGMIVLRASIALAR